MDIAVYVIYKPNMDADTLLLRLGQALRQARRSRGLTQAAAAKRAGLIRGRVIQAEKGDGSLSMHAYAKLAASLGMAFTLTPAVRPTLDEIHEVMRRV
jgi:transcriptional regulator with XRE-family HTH domain